MGRKTVLYPPGACWYHAFGCNMGDEALERLKILINSSTPIVVIETVEEVRAVNLVRHACTELDLPTFSGA